MPVDHLGVVGNQFLRSAILAQRTLVVFLFNRKVAGIHVIIRALQRNEPTKFCQRFRTIIYTQIERAIFPWLTRRLSRDHKERGRLPAANVATDSLRGIEGGE